MKKLNLGLAPYIPLADMLVETFGKECEVVVHDLTDPEHSVVYVANGAVTGRAVGQGFEHFVKDMLLMGGGERDYVANGFFRKNEKLIRTSSVLIRDCEGKLIGALCINLDTTRVVQQIEYLQSFLPKPPQQDKASPPEGNRVEDMVLSLIDNILAGCDSRLLTREERIEKIRFMDTRGIFQMKGSIEKVAERLGINKVTVYSYLDEARGKR
ncbi:MAG: PAS domain-containing protein [Acidaminococcaceae bacterium]|nr:PAS domain-containing protein [Acidaminococcaceae bacterium]